MTTSTVVMTTITVVSVCDDILGECQGVFDAEGNLLGAWHDNDANWRGEYFAPFMAKLGIKATTSHTPTDAQHKALCVYFGA